MNKKYLEKVKNLREEIPIGLIKGFQLMKEVDGDLNKAKAVIKERSLAVITEQTKLSEFHITPYLIKYNYDTSRIIGILEEELCLINGIPHSVAAYTLHKFKNDKELALTRVASLIEKSTGLKRLRPFEINGLPWFLEEEIVHLNHFHLCVIALTEWLDYEDAEGLSQAIHHNSNLVATQMQLINLKEMAAALSLARNIYFEIYNRHDKYNSQVHKYQNIYEELSVDEDYNHALSYLKENRGLLIKKLYEFVKENLEQFQW